MPFTIDHFIRARPSLYHLTSRSNLARIQRTKQLHPASHILTAGGQGHLLAVRRRQHTEVQIEGETVHVRDQAPFHQGNVAFDGGWTLADFIQDLNSHVFFWPGTADRAIDYAHRHFARYADEQPIVLRLRLAAVVRRNPGLEPLFCKFNSGSPRCSYGNKSPRGPDTFASCGNAQFSRGQVVEVTFRGALALPDECEYADSYNGPWSRLLDAQTGS